MKLDFDDIEQSLLTRRMRPLLSASDDLLSATKILRQVIVEDLEKMIAGAEMDGVDYAVFSGVQIHTDEAELVWPGDAYAVVAGEKSSLVVAR